MTVTSPDRRAMGMYVRVNRERLADYQLGEGPLRVRDRSTFPIEISSFPNRRRDRDRSDRAR